MNGTAARKPLLRKPPLRILMRAMNAVPGLLLRSPLHGLMSGNVLLLTFTGRKSGKHYTTPMSYVRENGVIFMSTESSWWKNLLVKDGAGADVVLRLRGHETYGVAEAITDEEGVVEGLNTILYHYPGYSRFIGVTMDEHGQPEPETVVSAARRGRVLVRVRSNESLRATE